MSVMEVQTKFNTMEGGIRQHWEYRITVAGSVIWSQVEPWRTQTAHLTISLNLATKLTAKGGEVQFLWRENKKKERKNTWKVGKCNAYVYTF